MKGANRTKNFLKIFSNNNVAKHIFKNDLKTLNIFGNMSELSYNHERWRYYYRTIGWVERGGHKSFHFSGIQGSHLIDDVNLREDLMRRLK